MVVTIDCETTTFQSGNPFSERNKLCCVGVKRDDTPTVVLDIEYSGRPYGSNLAYIKECLSKADTVVGFNLKFEMNWLRRYGIIIPETVQLIDKQITHYLESYQQHAWPSLNEVCEYHGLPIKPDKIKEYWDQGMDTTEIPWHELEEYNAHDVDVTYQIPYTDSPLVRLACGDLFSTSEMEWNGILWDSTIANTKSRQILEQVDELDGVLSEYIGGVPVNWGSPAHVSAVLFGGTIKESYHEEYIFTYKDGRQAPKIRKSERLHKLTGLISPGKIAKPLVAEGQYSTDDGTLRSLPAKGKAAKVIKLILERRGLLKLQGTYYEGFTKKIAESDWNGNFIHTNFGHCTTRTGRLGSSSPNIQNIPDDVRECLVSRFP